MCSCVCETVQQRRLRAIYCMSVSAEKPSLLSDCHITSKYESIFCSDIWLFMGSHEFDHVFSFNGFLGLSQTSMAVLFEWTAVEMGKAERDGQCGIRIKLLQYSL